MVSPVPPGSQQPIHNCLHTVQEILLLQLYGLPVHCMQHIEALMPVSHSITRRYGERMTEDQHDGWTCPRCQNYCDCIKCIRIQKVCGTSSPSAQTLPTTRKVWGESRLTRARAKKESAAAPSQPLISPPEPTAAAGADQEWLPHEDALYVAPGETAENVGGWTLAEFQDTDNGSYKPLAFQTYLDLASDSTLLSTPTLSSTVPSPLIPLCIRLPPMTLPSTP